MKNLTLEVEVTDIIGQLLHIFTIYFIKLCTHISPHVIKLISESNSLPSTVSLTRGKEKDQRRSAKRKKNTMWYLENISHLFLAI